MADTRQITLPSAAVDAKIGRNAEKQEQTSQSKDNKSSLTVDESNEKQDKEELETDGKEKNSQQLAQSEEVVQRHWVVDDIFTFENLGFSKTVNGLKYLACAACEYGPIGVHQPTDQKSYLSFSRITYKPS